jgi:hypothetical protein
MHKRYCLTYATSIFHEVFKGSKDFAVAFYGGAMGGGEITAERLRSTNNDKNNFGQWLVGHIS